jgi:hypothetical protein
MNNYLLISRDKIIRPSQSPLVHIQMTSYIFCEAPNFSPERTGITSPFPVSVSLEMWRKERGTVHTVSDTAPLWPKLLREAFETWVSVRVILQNFHSTYSVILQCFWRNFKGTALKKSVIKKKDRPTLATTKKTSSYKAHVGHEDETPFTLTQWATWR